jgi:hypothetical protein
MTGYEYRVLEVRVRAFPATAIPSHLADRVDEVSREGWELDKCVPVMAKGLLGGSYTDSILLFFRRTRR